MLYRLLLSTTARLAVWVATSAALVLSAGVLAAPVGATPSSDLLDVVRVGTGTATLTNAATAASIVPLLSNGTVGTPVALPTAASGSQHPFAISGSATSEGALSLSSDGNYLMVAGYGATPGTAGQSGAGDAINDTAATSVPRVVARIDASLAVDTSTALTDAFSLSNVRGVTSDNGSHFWVTGDGGNGNNASIVYASALGATTSTAVVASAPKQARVPVIAGGQLYMTGSKSPGPGVLKVGSGLPTTSGQTATKITSTADPYGAVFVHLGPTGSAPDTLYVADGTTGGILKYSLIGSTWTAEGTAGAGTALASLTGKVESGAVQLYATTSAGDKVLAFTDSSGASATISSGSLTTVTTAPANTLYRGIAFAPTGQTPPPPPTPAPVITLGDSSLGAVVGDPANPTLSLTVADDTVTTDQLTVSATSSNPAVVANGGIAVGGNGTLGPRTISLTPAGAVGYSTITVTATTPDAVSSTATFLYGASAAAPDASSSYLYGASDASTAIDVGGGYYVVGDDESDVLRLYRGGVSGEPVKSWDFRPQMGSPAEIDIEAAARTGDTIYWTGSMGNSKTGEVRPDESTLFATTISGSGASTDLGFVGYYKGLRNDLLAWDAANGDQYGLNASAAAGQIPKEINGFSVEGMEFAAGSSTTAYLGFRAPIVPVASRQQALVVPVTNLTDLVTGAAAHATFGTPLQWNLTPPGSATPNGVREIRKNADDQYLVIAGSYAGGGSFSLYTWDGVPADQPVLSDTSLPISDGGSWEGIPSVPDPLVAGDALTLIADEGSTDWYGDGSEAKDLPTGLTKARADVFSLALPAQTISFISTPPGAAYSGTAYAVSATGGGSGNPVQFSIDPSSSAGACTVSGGAVQLTGAGTCTVDADQAGSFQYAAAATASQTFTVQVPPAPVVSVPPDITTEATSAGGAAVGFSASATDAVDGTDPVSCTPPPGSTFPLGTTVVQCSATDSAGVTGSASFDVTVQDTTAPSIAGVPSDISVSATGPGGAVVDYAQPTANDQVDGVVVVSCAPSSGSTFPLGTTTVSCSATDASGNTAHASFDVTVGAADVKAPVIKKHAMITRPATGPSGAAVAYSVVVTDKDTPVGDVTVSCVPASGSVFPVGTTTVTCNAHDPAGNQAAQMSFAVRVRDTHAPVIARTAAIKVVATGPSGAVVSYTTPTATDDVDGSVPVSCAPASGSTFKIGSTTVKCTAHDAAGHVARSSFRVTVSRK